MKKTASVIFISILLPLAVRADVIDWGFELVQTPTSSFDSTGAALDTTYTFYLGKFDSSFSAERNNFNDWATNWTTFDVTGFDDGALNWFNSSANLNDNTVFGITDQAFIWGTNGALGDTGENILITSANWLFPSAQPTDPTVTEFFLSDAALVAEFGAVNSTYSGNETGISNNLGSFDIQTEAVPEPSGVILLGLGLSALLFRRKSRANGDRR